MSVLICYWVKSHTNTVFNLAAKQTSSDTDGQMLPLSVHALMLWLTLQDEKFAL